MTHCLSGLLAVSVLFICGCKSHPLGPYTSPRVTGMVTDLEERPLAGVEATRGRPATTRDISPKGGELMIRKPPVVTDVHGRFVFESERVLSVVRGAGWGTVSLTFGFKGYATFQTNCPTWLATNSPSGEPVLDVGVIRLAPTKAK